MRTVIKTTALVAFLSLSTLALAAPTNTIFNITAVVLKALTVTNTQALSFGLLSTSGSAQSIVIAPTGTTAAIFSITGDAGVTVTASVVSATTTLTCTAQAGDVCTGVDTMSVNSFTFGGDLSGAGVSSNATGSLTNARIGATLAVAANQKSGHYAGTNTISVTY